MPRTKFVAFDWRKGLATSFSQDARDHYELAVAKNARLGAEYAAITKRASTQRLQLTAVGGAAPVLGVQSWRPSARQVVAVSGTDFHYKAQGDTDFTTVAASLSSTVPPIFSRHTIAGTPTMFFAEGTMRKWTGAALTDVATAPAGARFLCTYKGRMFLTDNTKTIYWSKVADPETWASPDGGQANVDTYDAEPIVGMAQSGSSLLIFKENSVARFTGVSQDDIKIDEETEGVAPDVGCIAPGTIIRVEDLVFFLSNKGPYVATEAGVTPVGVKIENVFRSIARDYLSLAVAVYHRLRGEVWLFVPPTGATANTTGYCLNVRQQAWTGPWAFSGFNPAAMCSHELDDGSDTVLIGGYDGFVRNGDVESLGAKDDVLRAGTGGTNVTLEVELPTLIFGDPHAVKRLTPTQSISADLKTSGALLVTVSSDLISGSVQTTLNSKGAGVKQYELRPGVPGRRFTWNMQDATSEIVQVNGLELEAEIARRVS